MNNIDNTLIVTIYNARKQIISTLNSLYAKGIPYYIIEPFINDIASQVQQNASEELKIALKEYNESQTKKNNIKEEQEVEEQDSTE